VIAPRFQLALVLLCAGCATHSGPYTPQSEAARDTAKAQSLTQRAAAVIDKDPKKAESLLRDALTADLYHGPAHNDLGITLLRRSDLYGAASEFEWAARLMPNHPDPRMNLALTLEKAGRVDEALTAYATALEVYQGHIPTIEAMTRLQIKSGKTNEKTRTNLEEIAYKGETEKWREWARLQLTRTLP
jgi:Flp pilus assembly protein TadD